MKRGLRNLQPQYSGRLSFLEAPRWSGSVDLDPVGGGVARQALGGAIPRVNHRVAAHGGRATAVVFVDEHLVPAAPGDVDHYRPAGAQSRGDRGHGDEGVPVRSATAVERATVIKDRAARVEAPGRLRRGVELGRRGRSRPDVVVHHRIGGEQATVAPDSVDAAVAQQGTAPPRVTLGVPGTRGDAGDGTGARAWCGEVFEQNLLHDLARVAVDDHFEDVEAILGAEHVALNPGIAHELVAGHDVLAEVKVGVRLPHDPLGFGRREHLVGFVTHLQEREGQIRPLVEHDVPRKVVGPVVLDLGRDTLVGGHVVDGLVLDVLVTAQEEEREGDVETDRSH